MSNDDPTRSVVYWRLRIVQNAGGLVALTNALLQTPDDLDCAGSIECAMDTLKRAIDSFRQARRSASHAADIDSHRRTP